MRDTPEKRRARTSSGDSIVCESSRTVPLNSSDRDKVCNGLVKHPSHLMVFPDNRVDTKMPSWMASIADAPGRIDAFPPDTDAPLLNLSFFITVRCTMSRCAQRYLAH